MPPSLPSLQDDHAVLREAVRDAGGAVLDRFKSKTTKSWTKDDASPVTEADLEANDILRQRLIAGPRSHYGWLSEESADDHARLSAPRTWVIDPIDGTRAFMRGAPEFAVCAALLEGETAVSAIIFNPATDEFFEATRHGGAFCNGERMTANARSSLEGCSVLAAPEMFERPEWPQPWPLMRTFYRSSTSYRMALVARGDADAAIALLPKADWDVVMGTLIAQEAGAVTSDHLGSKYRFNQPTPYQRALVCAVPDLYPSLIGRLNHLPGELQPYNLNSIAERLPLSENQQLLHLVLGGELKSPNSAEFKDPSNIDIVGVFPSYTEAEAAWRSKAQQTVDSAHTRYFIVHLHRLLDPDGDGKLG